MMETRPAMRVAPIQFELRHIFLLVWLVASAIALGRFAGPLIPVLVMGLGIVAILLNLMKIENLILAGIAGAAISIPVLLFILLAYDVSTMIQFGCLVGYPIFGYSVGILDAANRAIRSGM